MDLSLKVNSNYDCVENALMLLVLQVVEMATEQSSVTYSAINLSLKHRQMITRRHSNRQDALFVHTVDTLCC